MTVSTASVPTDRPARYGKQLVSHLTRRATGEWDESSGSGWVDFGAGKAHLTAGADALALHLDATEPARLENVIGRHLVRFGARDELVVSWVRDDGTPGTSYRNDGAEEPAGERGPRP